MNWFSVLRLPSPRFPNDLATGDAVMDSYLEELDGYCLGSASVRRLYLSEIRDNLLEARDQAVAEGLSREVAAKRVVADFGPAKELARVQRQGRWRDFRRGGLIMGLAFAVLMLIFHLLSGSLATMGPVLLAGMFVFHGLFFGLLMGLWYSFMFAPTDPRPSFEDGDSESGFLVYSPRSSRWLAVLMMVVMTGMAVATVAGTLGLGFMANAGVVGNAFLTLIALHVVLSMRVAFIRIQADQEQLHFRGLGTECHIPLNAITGFRPAKWWERVLTPIAGANYRLYWRGKDGERATWLGLNGEMTNADRLRVLLDTSGSERKAAD
ncbi:hypothetical protein J2T60_001367 [Natronospira proteinivora]|uniref:PH (Pleckstrin Homology) domain-containing protein n=1 Tax=Natronospira proteinivora TaxID=1807133 RepID=A0ABT1GBU3_9GAMM|nr:permease prefix domain 1-containing protein [Natronospira proteinivora]MCP1727402.1 hypothetical protein [Natronospira proteinivora]